MNRNFDWNTAVRWAAGLSALFLWGLSIYWSGDGFTKLGSGVSPDKAWLGIALGLIFTVIQLVWNRMRGGSKDNLTIWVMGLMVYTYSLITDFFGITDWFGFSKGVNFESLFAVFMSLLVEVLPEPFVLWSITGSFTGGDFLSNIFGSSSSSPVTSQYKKSNASNMGFSQARNNSTIQSRGSIDKRDFKQRLGERIQPKTPISSRRTRGDDIPSFLRDEDED